MLVLVGFLPPDDPRIVATVEAIEADLLVDGFVLRYRTDVAPDGSPLAEDGSGLGRRPAARRGRLPAHHVLAGRQPRDARPHRRRPPSGSRRCWPCATTSVCCRRNGTSSTGRMVGNFPQAFSHVGLLNSAGNLARGAEGPAARRADGRQGPRTDPRSDRLNRLPNPSIDREPTSDPSRLTRTDGSREAHHRRPQDADRPGAGGRRRLRRRSATSRSIRMRCDACATCTTSSTTRSSTCATCW